jgi:hypothetical protein
MRTFPSNFFEKKLQKLKNKKTCKYFSISGNTRKKD